MQKKRAFCRSHLVIVFVIRQLAPDVQLFQLDHALQCCRNGAHPAQRRYHSLRRHVPDTTTSKERGMLTFFQCRSAQRVKNRPQDRTWPKQRLISDPKTMPIPAPAPASAIVAQPAPISFARMIACRLTTGHNAVAGRARPCAKNCLKRVC